MTCGAGWRVARAPWQSACRTSVTAMSGTPAACGRPRRREGRARCRTTCLWAAAVVDDGIGKRVKTKNGKRKNMEQKPCEAAWVEFGVQTKKRPKLSPVQKQKPRSPIKKPNARGRVFGISYR
jgi:hypothetical protein